MSPIWLLCNQKGHIHMLRICKRSHTQSLHSRILFWLKVSSSELLHMAPLKWSYHFDLCWSPRLGIKSFHFLPKAQFYLLVYEPTSNYLTSRLFITQHYVLYQSNQVLFPLAICSCLGLPSAKLCHQLQSLVFVYSIFVGSEGSEEIHFSNVTKIPQRYVEFISICAVSTSLVCWSYQEVVKQN